MNHTEMLRRVEAVVHPPEVHVSLDALRRIVQALRVGRGGEGSAGLGSAQLFALQQIAEHPGASINDIAALTCTHQSSVSVVIQRLVRRRYVAKAASRQDGRRQQLSVTPKGWRLLRRAPVAAQEFLIAAIAALPETDRRVLARSLSSVAQLVAPVSVGQRPPMFFEDDVSARRSTRRSEGRRRRT